MPLLLLSVLGCGAKEGPTIQVTLRPASTADAALVSDPRVIDVVARLESQVVGSDVFDDLGNLAIAAGSFLDEDGDSQPDALIYPTACRAGLTSGCGFNPAAATFELTELPINQRYTMTIRYRSAAGAPLYQGAATFDNIENGTTSVTVSMITCGNCP